MSGPDLEQVVIALRSGQTNAASGMLQAILADDPDNFDAGWLLLQCLEAQRNRDAAAEQLDRLAAQSAGRPGDLDRLAQFAYQHGLSLAAVIRAMERHREARPENLDALFNRAFYLARDARYEEAIGCYREAIRRGIRAPEQAELNIASIYMDHLHDPGRARKHIDNARRLNPRAPAVYQNLGTLAEQLGDRVLAKRAFEKCLELQPDNHAILARLADAHRFTDPGDPLLERLERAVPSSPGADLHFALGRAYDQLRQYDEAWRHFRLANDRDARRFPPYEPDRAEEMFAEIARTPTTPIPASTDAPSAAPVFICGLFRSGSTLLEKILGAHGSFVATGESEFFPRLMARHLPYYPEGLEHVTDEDLQDWRDAYLGATRELTGGGRIIDKRPENFLIAGLIRAILPEARFIVTERDPRDMAVSIFATRLNPRQVYATRLAHIRHYLALHRRLVEHWESVLEGSLVRIPYESLVREPRATLEPLLNWLGEDWDDACLDFHATGDAVRTVSAWQVREPLHDRSIGRWRNYSGPVGEVFDAGS